ncbi:hypothetical protein Ae201684_003328 [Aphanomyces euteiches]|uniref:Uncharacterized protein n=1 Tax=Aphanomyces euteiches TaxID=100861 RepID=A0A6G0XMP6_9STRA|nr:hypothetical protein Ae201684_003328 [Aphanomyces euteiches]KAH9157713.1 hypothetical protein AeRB84_000448 [Aphanomyces euteiches]
MGNALPAVSKWKRDGKLPTSSTNKEPMEEPAKTKLPTAPDKALLFIEDHIVSSAEWNGENVFVYLKRFCGAMNESETEGRKRKQKLTTFVPGVHNTFNFKLNQETGQVSHDAIIAAKKLQVFLRRHMYRVRWREAVETLVSRLREEHRLQQEETALESMVTRFREILRDGLTASKVSTMGVLKTVVLRLVIDTTFDECYITWTPSKKREPRILMHDIDKVVAATKTMSGVPNHLLRKVSHRRTFVFCIRSSSSSHSSSGRGVLPRRFMILQVANSKERDFLIKGFQRFLENRASYLDDSGVPRMDKRKAALAFFNPPAVPTSPTSSEAVPAPAMSRLEQLEFKEQRRRQARQLLAATSTVFSDDEENEEDDEDSQRSPVSYRAKERAASVVPLDASSAQPLLSHFYSTRFDAMDEEAKQDKLPSENARGRSSTERFV